MFNRLKKYRFVFLGLGIFILMMLAASFMNLNMFAGRQQTIAILSSWFNGHKTTTILWHILLSVAIYFGWGYKVNKAIKAGKIDELRGKKMMRIRWLMIGFIFLIDLLRYL